LTTYQLEYNSKDISYMQLSELRATTSPTPCKFQLAKESVKH
jgi:hypothetical protein